MATKKIILDENELCLKIQTHVGNSEPAKMTVFPLTEITPIELSTIRQHKTPILIFKSNENLYYTQCPKNLNLLGSNSIGNHICAGPRHVCERLSAATDEMGGCKKVRQRSKGIEKMKFIGSGIETHNTCCDILQVFKCSHYKEAFDYTAWQKTLSYEEQKEENEKVRNLKNSLKIFAIN